MARPGYGKTGYCSICDHLEGWRFIEGVTKGGKSGNGWNAVEAQEAGRSFGLEFSRQTWYTHQKHVKDGRPSTAQKAIVPFPGNALEIKRSSNTEYLETIRDIGMAKVLANPSAVTTEQALKAVQIMEGRKEKPSDSINILVQFVTGHPPAVVVEGEAREVEEGSYAEPDSDR